LFFDRAVFICTTAQVETVYVKNRGPVDLRLFTCTKTVSSNNCGESRHPSWFHQKVRLHGNVISKNLIAGKTNAKPGLGHLVNHFPSSSTLPSICSICRS
jgi:hypothetical protein